MGWALFSLEEERGFLCVCVFTSSAFPLGQQGPGYAGSAALLGTGLTSGFCNALMVSNPP